MTNEQLTQEIINLKEHQAKAEAEHETFQVILTELQEGIKENRELTMSVKEIATEMKHLREDQTDMNKRLKVIEEKPVKEYEETKSKIKWQIIGFVLGIILMFLAFKLGLKDFI